MTVADGRAGTIFIDVWVGMTIQVHLLDLLL
jgi:hypothetical protein